MSRYTGPHRWLHKRPKSKKRKAEALEGIKFTPRTQPAAWRAWMAHYRAANNRFAIDYWVRCGYMRQATLFPPNDADAQYRPELADGRAA